MEARRTRRPTRLKEYDYSSNGAYFITFCVKNHEFKLWEPVKFTTANVGANIVRPRYDLLPLSFEGRAVDDAINQIHTIYPCVFVDKYVVMPNHIHMILVINRDDTDNNCLGRTMFAPTISRIIKQLKGIITKRIGYSMWQRTFHDHIIRNDEDYIRIWEYIDTNPMKWADDCCFIPNF